jgi:hypothetical protein
VHSNGSHAETISDKQGGSHTAGGFLTISRNAYEVLRRTELLLQTGKRREGIKMRIKEVHLKIIAIGLVPVFLILAFALPKTAATTILLGAVMFAGFVITFIGMSMQKQESEGNEDLLAIPPKKS